MYYYLEVIQSEDKDFSNYVITDERYIINVKNDEELVNNIIDTLMFHYKNNYYEPVANFGYDDEFLGVRLFKVDNDGEMEYSSTVSGTFENDGNEYILDFEDINNRRFRFYSLDESKNYFKGMWI